MQLPSGQVVPGPEGDADVQQRCQRCGDPYLITDEWDNPDYCLDCFEWLQDTPIRDRLGPPSRSVRS